MMSRRRTRIIALTTAMLLGWAAVGMGSASARWATFNSPTLAIEVYPAGSSVPSSDPTDPGGACPTYVQGRTGFMDRIELGGGQFADPWNDSSYALPDLVVNASSVNAYLGDEALNANWVVRRPDG